MYIVEEIDNVNPVLNQVIIKNKNLDFQGIIYPNLGASLQKLSFRGIDIIDGIECTDEGLLTYENKYNSSFLFPFPGRIPNGKYVFNNVEYELDCNDPGFNGSLHGHIHNKRFTVQLPATTDKTATVKLNYTDTGTKGFPFSYLIEITFTFSEEKLKIDVEVFNNGHVKFPFGIGWHPYFKAKNLRACSLDFQSEHQLLLNENLVPERKTPFNYSTPLLVSETHFDDCFILKKPEASFRSNEFSMNLKFSSKSPDSFLQIYTPPARSGIAIEPMTCAGNCFNNKMGLQVLEPNSSYKWQNVLTYSCVD